MYCTLLPVTGTGTQQFVKMLSPLEESDQGLLNQREELLTDQVTSSTLVPLLNKVFRSRFHNLYVQASLRCVQTFATEGCFNIRMPKGQSSSATTLNRSLGLTRVCTSKMLWYLQVARETSRHPICNFTAGFTNFRAGLDTSLNAKKMYVHFELGSSKREYLMTTTKKRVGTREVNRNAADKSKTGWGKRLCQRF